MRGLDRLSGLGIGASLDEAGGLCLGKLAGDREFARLSYLNIGVSSDEPIPPELPELMARAELGCTLHFIELDLVAGLAGQAQAVERLAAAVEALAPAWVQEDIGLWRWRGMSLFGHMLNPVLDERTLAVVAANCAYLSRRMGRPFLAENPPVYFCVEEIDLLTFMGEIAERADCGLILDIGHFIGYCVATGREPAPYLAGWKQAGRVRELHLAGYHLAADQPAPSWLDDHARAIEPYAIELAEVAIGCIGHRPPITLELDLAPPDVVDANIRRVASALCQS